MAAELHQASLLELSAMLERGEVTSAEAALAALDRIKRVDGKVHAFLRVDSEGALRQAAESDERRKAGARKGPLDGIPLGLKDLFNQEGTPTTAGSRILEGYISPYSATVVERLRQAGAVIVGKLNMDEFAMGSSTENSAFGVTANPWDLQRTPGGSSGGSSAAVAAGEVFGALGTDTGGSIRQPASLCGIAGLKPTYGRVSRYGVVAFASSLDQPGPMARTVSDCAALLGAIAGHDPRDATSSRSPVPNYLSNLEKGVRGLRLGVPREYFVAGMDPEVEVAVQASIELYRHLGAEIREVSLPHTPYALSCYYLVATAEASSNLARYDGVRFGRRAPEATNLLEMYRKTRAQGFGPEVKRRVMLGTYALSSGYYDAYYLRAQKVRTLIRRDFDRAFESVDALLTPTSPTAAFKLGEKVSDPLQMYLADVFTLSCNLAGLPGISIPCGFTHAGLPIGLQLLGRPFDEATLLMAARAHERETDWHRRAPGGLA